MIVAMRMLLVAMLIVVDRRSMVERILLPFAVVVVDTDTDESERDDADDDVEDNGRSMVA
jgi:hypothetical protein